MAEGHIERVVIGPETSWFWDHNSVNHVARYRLARDRIRDASILDAACGTGYGSAMLADRARQVVGVDISADAIDFARRAWPRGNVRFELADVMTVPIADGTLDAVVSFETIEHVADPAALLAEFHRVLRPGGRLIISTPDRDCYGEGKKVPNPFHIAEMSKDEFVAELRRSFRIDELYGQSAAAIRETAGVDPAAASRDARDGLRHRSKSAVKRLTGPILSRPAIGRRAVPVLRRWSLPQPIGSGRWKYVVAVCTRD